MLQKFNRFVTGELLNRSLIKMIVFRRKKKEIHFVKHFNDPKDTYTLRKLKLNDE